MYAVATPMEQRAIGIKTSPLAHGHLGDSDQPVCVPLSCGHRCWHLSHHGIAYIRILGRRDRTNGLCRRRTHTHYSELSNRAPDPGSGSVELSPPLTALTCRRLLASLRCWTTMRAALRGDETELAERHRRDSIDLLANKINDHRREPTVTTRR